jgi:Protein of unknown function (DUF3489)
VKVFAINAENNITAHSSRKAARETGSDVFSTEEQFADLIGPDSKRLVEIWNSLPGVRPVTKFTNRKVATERIWKAIQNLGPDARATRADEPEAAEERVEQTEPAALGEAERGATPADAESQPEAGVRAPGPDVAPALAEPTKKATRAKKTPGAPRSANGAREGSKTAMVLDLMKQEGGVTSKELMAATGWQPHSVRGFISGTLGKKMGLTVVSAKVENGERSYSIQA